MSGPEKLSLPAGSLNRYNPDRIISEFTGISGSPFVPDARPSENNLTAPSSIYIIMGVSGSGKTTIGRLLAHYLRCSFFDADNFHPPDNIAKMAAGIPLTDDDRIPWLDRLHALITGHINTGQPAVLACSALKKSYRDHLRGSHTTVRFIYLDGRFDLIQQRMQSRQDHYMKPEMLQSQFQTLEIPNPQEALIIDIDQPTQTIIQEILNHIDLPPH